MRKVGIIGAGFMGSNTAIDLSYLVAEDGSPITEDILVIDPNNGEDSDKCGFRIHAMGIEYTLHEPSMKDCIVGGIDHLATSPRDSLTQQRMWYAVARQSIKSGEISYQNEKSAIEVTAKGEFARVFNYYADRNWKNGNEDWRPSNRMAKLYEMCGVESFDQLYRRINHRNRDAAFKGDLGGVTLGHETIEIGSDPNSRKAHQHAQMDERGIHLMLGHRVKEIKPHENGYLLYLEGDNDPIYRDIVICAANAWNYYLLHKLDPQQAPVWDFGRAALILRREGTPNAFPSRMAKLGENGGMLCSNPSSGEDYEDIVAFRLTEKATYRQHGSEKTGKLLTPADPYPIDLYGEIEEGSEEYLHWMVDYYEEVIARFRDVKGYTPLKLERGHVIAPTNILSQKPLCEPREVLPGLFEVSGKITHRQAPRLCAYMAWQRMIHPDADVISLPYAADLIPLENDPQNQRAHKIDPNRRRSIYGSRDLGTENAPLSAIKLIEAASIAERLARAHEVGGP